MGPYAVVDYNFTLSRPEHIYHGQLYARFDLNQMPKSTLSSSQGLGVLASDHGTTVQAPDQT